VEITDRRKTMAERDPHGKPAKAPGAKLDAGKIRPDLIFRGFARALKEVARVGTFGADKYSDDGWMVVENGRVRYTDALYRHLLQESIGEVVDPESELHHAAHSAWNALARLELMLRENASHE
jgi:hypothetical protein